MENGISICAVSGTPSIGPDNWKGATFRRMLRKGREIRGPELEKSAASGFARAVGNFDSERKSLEGGPTLKGMRVGCVGAGGEGKGVGTGDPLEAGTLSAAGTPVPFGESFASVDGLAGD